jgi:glycolate oxidase iron-sulfur subunit
LLQGCVQQVGTPQVNEALARLLGARGFESVYAANEACCGSLNLHLGARDRALADVRGNIDALRPYLHDVDAVISTASGCGVTVKDYPRLMAGDVEYQPWAEALAARCLDAAEFVSGLDGELAKLDDIGRVAWQSPCTLQHGQQIAGVVEALLTQAGYELVAVRDSDQCCGSAGTYSLLQPDLSTALRSRKLAALGAGEPDVIATANVGCQLHLAAASTIPVRHWLELLR